MSVRDGWHRRCRLRLAGGRAGWLRGLLVTIAALSLGGPARLTAQVPPEDAPVVEAREALRRGDRARLLALRQQLLQAGHPLAGWVDYWDLSSRLPQAAGDEVERFHQRWSGSYVEDRLRNDWLLELGRRRDWAAFGNELPRFRMADDREVRCYGLVAELLSGRDPQTLRETAIAAWFAQRDGDDGCQLLASQLRDAGQLPATAVWQRLRLSVDAGRARAARQAAQLIGPGMAAALDALWDNPARTLTRLGSQERSLQAPIGTLAAMRLAAGDPAVAARQLEAPWAQTLPPEWAAALWASLARQGVQRQLPEATEWADRAVRALPRVAAGQAPGDEALAWVVRAQLRATPAQPQAWAAVVAAIDAMSESERADPAWGYWRARALLARSRPGSAGDAPLLEAQALLQRVASPWHFYGQLALEELGARGPLPAAAAPPTPAENEAAAALPGLQRAQRLMAAGLRSEGVREWNFTLLGLSERQLLAAAALACERQIWDRCIQTAERNRQEIDATLRYPAAFRDEITPAAAAAGLEPWLISGLIRQESRFVVQARSSVGASGLMQVMPPTARWMARRLGMELKPDWREDRATNLRLGTQYLRLVLDDVGGSLPMALAAYNAGPGRPRRWREGPVLEPAIWVESIPFLETRDYVKKVLANATVYAARFGTPTPASLKSLLGRPIGPRDPDAPEPSKDLP